MVHFLGQVFCGANNFLYFEFYHFVLSIISWVDNIRECRLNQIEINLSKLFSLLTNTRRVSSMSALTSSIGLKEEE